MTVWVQKTHLHYKNNNACIKFIWSSWITSVIFWTKHTVIQYTLTGSIPSPMVPPLREALLKFHALMSGTIKNLPTLSATKATRN